MAAVEEEEEADEGNRASRSERPRGPVTRRTTKQYAPLHRPAPHLKQHHEFLVGRVGELEGVVGGGEVPEANDVERDWCDHLDAILACQPVAEEARLGAVARNHRPKLPIGYWEWGGVG